MTRLCLPLLLSLGTIFLAGCGRSVPPSGRDLGDQRTSPSAAQPSRVEDLGGRPAETPARHSSPVEDLLKARAGFRTKIIPNSYKTDGPAKSPKPGTYKLVRYPSPAGRLAAYLTPDPGDGKKHPALIWAHGGFGGLGTGVVAEPARAAGFVVLCPSWRGENDNPGQFELFYGEVEDAVAAVEYVRQLPYVDAARVYLAGHSTGGTMTLLTVEATSKLRAAFSFGGCPDVGNLMALSQGVGYGNTPFDHRNSQETRLRSASHFVAAIHTPTFFFEGEESALYCRDAKNMEQSARRAGVPFSAFILKGGDHFNILLSLPGLIVDKMRADTGEKCNITFTPEEVQKTFQERVAPLGLLPAQNPGLPITLHGHTYTVFAVAFSPDGSTLASASGDQTIKLWDVKSGTERTTLEGHAGQLSCLVYSPDGTTLASGCWDKTIKLWDVKSGKERATLKGHTEEVAFLAFSPDGRTLASASNDKTIKLWDVKRAQERACLKGHTSGVSSVAYSPDGKTLASASVEKTIRLWDVKTGKQQATLKGHTDSVLCLAYSSDGTTLASGSWDRTIKLWDVKRGAERVSLKGHKRPVYAVAFSPDGKNLASAGSTDKTIKLWDVKTGKERGTLQGDASAVCCVAYSPDGKTLASGGADRTIKLWEVSALKLPKK